MLNPTVNKPSEEEPKVIMQEVEATDGKPAVA